MTILLIAVISVSVLSGYFIRYFYDCYCVWDMKRNKKMVGFKW